jgi:two-component system cell cycle response regulator
MPFNGRVTERLVLIGEDDDPVADALAEAISDEAGYRTVIMSDGTFVLETARRIRPDALILDVGLPGMNGFEIYDQLRADPATERIPVIFITAAAETFTGDFADRGITDVIAKPFDLELALARLRELCPAKREEGAPQPA